MRRPIRALPTLSAVDTTIEPVLGGLSRDQSDVGDQSGGILPEQNRFGCHPCEIALAQPFSIEIPYGIGFQHRDVDRLAGLDHKAVGSVRCFEVFFVNIGLGFRLGFRLRLGIGIFVGIVVVVVRA